MRAAECGGEGAQDVGEPVGFGGGQVTGRLVVVADEGDVGRPVVIDLEGEQYLQRVGPPSAVQVGDRDGVCGQFDAVGLADVLVATRGGRVVLAAPCRAAGPPDVDVGLGPPVETSRGRLAGDRGHLIFLSLRAITFLLSTSSTPSWRERFGYSGMDPADTFRDSARSPMPLHEQG